MIDRILLATESVPLPYENVLHLTDVLSAISQTTDKMTAAERSELLASMYGADTANILLRQVSRRIASDMIAGQTDASSVTSNIRMLVTLPDTTLTVLHMSVPLLPSDVMSGTGASMVELDIMSSRVITIVETNAGSSNNSNILANPIDVSVEGMVCGDVPCVVTFDFRLHSSLPLVPDDKNRTTNETFITQCVRGVERVDNYTCVGGQVLVHNCTGDAERLSTFCPAVRHEPVCRFLVHDIPVLVDDLCRVISVNDSWTRCACTLSEDFLQYTTPSSRRLQSGESVGDAVLDYVQSFTVTALLEEISYEFVDTIRTADDTDLSTFYQARVVVGMFIALGVVAALCTIEQLRPSCYTPHKNPTGVTNRRISSRVSAVIAAGTVTLATRKAYLAKYLTSVLPAVFREESGWKALWNEILRHHRYVSLWTGVNSKHRTLTALHMLSCEIFLIYMLALAFDLEVRGGRGRGGC